VNTPQAALAAALEAEHRRLDDLFGRFLAAAESRDAPAAREAIEEFDEALRSHMALEEERLYPAPAGRKLVPGEGEEENDRRARELLLEHVQIREVSAMMRRLLAERDDLPGARSLAGNIARRWDAHTTREEREVFPGLKPDGV
jgi:hemerythrin HHE cation binding domain-containing protein